MDASSIGRAGNGLLKDWVDDLRAAGQRHGLSGDIVPLRGSMTGAVFVACVRRLGGSVAIDHPFHGWILRESLDGNDTIYEWAPELHRDDTYIGDFHGILRVSIGGETFLALRTDDPVGTNFAVRVLVLVGRTFEATLQFAAAVSAMRRQLVKSNRISVYGASQVLYTMKPTAEGDLILPGPFKRELLAFADGFGRAAAVCSRLGIAPSRGALFVGAPGTGKTQAVRHLLTRLPEFRGYILVVPNSGHDCGSKTQFELLLETMRALEEPSIVVIEDVDRVFEAKAVTPQFFLNVLDGLFQPPQPVLWIATSNDPRGMEANLLDRPGRFDRVFVFPLPGLEERYALLQRYCAWPLAEADLSVLAEESQGLTGAHLREVCYAAALEVAERPAEFGTEVGRQLEKVKGQHAKARSYDFELGEKKVGFGG